MRLPKPLLIILACAAVVPAVAGPLEDGEAAYDRKDFATAAKLWKPLAEQGNAIAQDKLGNLYEVGIGVPRDNAQAVAWYRKAANQGYADAQYNLAMMYAHGRGLPKDYTQMMDWYRKAADQGHAHAKTALAVGQFYAEEVRSHRKAAEGGDPIAVRRQII